MNDLFKGPRLKVERAYKHIGEIEQLIAAFSANNAHKLVTEFDPSTGLRKLRFETSERLPEFVNLALGDAVHNLRAALDYTWVQAILVFDPAADIENISFPLGCDTRDSLKGTLDDGKRKHAIAIATPGGQKLRGVMLDSIQVYGGWDNPLRMLNKLDNIDKHRLLLTLVVAGGVGVENATIGGMRAMGVSFVSTNPKAAIFETDGKIEGDMQPAVIVFINETELPKNQSVIPTLKKIAKLVSEAIDAIERCVSAHGSTP